MTERFSAVADCWQNSIRKFEYGADQSYPKKPDIAIAIGYVGATVAKSGCVSAPRRDPL
jgi:hypothetical protein